MKPKSRISLKSVHIFRKKKMNHSIWILVQYLYANSLEIHFLVKMPRKKFILSHMKVIYDERYFFITRIFNIQILKKLFITVSFKIVQILKFYSDDPQGCNWSVSKGVLALSNAPVTPHRRFSIMIRNNRVPSQAPGKLVLFSFLPNCWSILNLIC